MLSRLFKLGLILLFSMSLSSCFFSYHYPVQQGTLIHANKVARLRRGMRVAQVMRLLGAPLLNNLYYNQQLVYVYTLKVGHHPLEVKRLVIYFRHGRVTHYKADGLSKAEHPIDVPQHKLKKAAASSKTLATLPSPHRTATAPLPKPRHIHFAHQKLPLKSQYQKVISHSKKTLLPVPTLA